jgi:hypothetical protein
MQPIVTNTGSESDHEQIESSPGHSESKYSNTFYFFWQLMISTEKRRRKGVTKFRLTPEQRYVVSGNIVLRASKPLNFLLILIFF